MLLYNNGHVGQLTMPYIPGILGFMSKIVTAQPNNIPDFTRTDTFDDTVERTLNGHLFQPRAWTRLERATLLLLGMLYPIETNPEIDTSFNVYGKRLGLPISSGADSIRYLDEFLYLRNNNTWFGKILQIMGTYSTYFKATTSLAE